MPEQAPFERRAGRLPVRLARLIAAGFGDVKGAFEQNADQPINPAAAASTFPSLRPDRAALSMTIAA